MKKFSLQMYAGEGVDVSSKKAIENQFGKSIAQNIEPDVLLEKCDTRISLFSTWIKNLEGLKAKALEIIKEDEKQGREAVKKQYSAEELRKMADEMDGRA